MGSEMCIRDRAWFAKAAVRVDYENCWKLIEGSRNSKNETSGGFERHCGNMAHELAATNPERAEKLLREMKQNSQFRYAPRVAYRIGKTDPARAVKVMAEFMTISQQTGSWDRSHVIAGYSAVASSIVKTHPEEAQKLIGQGIMAFKHDSGNGLGLGASLSLLVHACEIDAANSERVFWILLDLSLIHI